MTWTDVYRAFMVCGAVLSLIFALLWAYETQMEIDSMQRIIAHLQAAQRPLVTVDGGKYLTIFTKEDEVLIETTLRKEDK